MLLALQSTEIDLGFILNTYSDFLLRRQFSFTVQYIVKTTKNKDIW